MAQSVLERVTELVVARLATYHLSFDQIVRMLQRTHANVMMTQKRHLMASTQAIRPLYGFLFGASLQCVPLDS